MIQFTSIIRNADKSWLFTWISTGATVYRVVLFGKQVDVTSLPSYVWRGGGYGAFPPPLEIASEDEKVLSEVYVPYLVIQWYSEPEADYYLVQKHDPTWASVAQFQNTGGWVLTYITPLLVDETEYDYRVLAVDSLGNQSLPQNYHKYVVCPPAPPDGTIAITLDKPNIRIA